MIKVLLVHPIDQSLVKLRVRVADPDPDILDSVLAFFLKGWIQVQTEHPDPFFL